MARAQYSPPPRPRTVQGEDLEERKAKEKRRRSLERVRLVCETVVERGKLGAARNRELRGRVVDDVRHNDNFLSLGFHL